MYAPHDLHPATAESLPTQCFPLKHRSREASINAHPAKSKPEKICMLYRRVMINNYSQTLWKPLTKLNYEWNKSEYRLRKTQTDYCRAQT